MKKKKKGKSKTPPMRLLEEKGIPYVLCQQGRKQYTAEGVANDLGVPVAQVVKAMIVQRPDDQFALIIIPGNKRLSLRKVAAQLREKHVALAEARDVQRLTGYQVGAVSVLGFRRRDIPGYLDQRVLDLKQVIISSGRPDVGLALSSTDLARALEESQLGDFCQYQ